MLLDTIVWGNEGPALGADPDSWLVASYSCIEGGEVWPGEGNTNADPLFVDPGRWEGSWIGGDFHLRPGSPAIDSGSCEGAPASDIEGDPRPTREGCDMGAYETPGPVPPRFVRGDANGDGSLTISDAVRVLRYLFGFPLVPPCIKAADADDDGSLALADPIAVLQYLFASGPPPWHPFPECGWDGRPDGLRCDAYPPCE